MGVLQSQPSFFFRFSFSFEGLALLTVVPCVPLLTVCLLATLQRRLGLFASSQEQQRRMPAQPHAGRAGRGHQALPARALRVPAPHAQLNGKREHRFRLLLGIEALCTRSSSGFTSQLWRGLRRNCKNGTANGTRDLFSGLDFKMAMSAIRFF